MDEKRDFMETLIFGKEMCGNSGTFYALLQKRIFAHANISFNREPKSAVFPFVIPKYSSVPIIFPQNPCPVPCCFAAPSKVLG